MSALPRFASSTVRVKSVLRRTLASLLVTGAFFGLASFVERAQAVDLGIEGQVFEPIEEDFRIALLRMVARQDWTKHIDGLTESARNYTKSLPDFYLPLAKTTQTAWKDVGIIVSEDVYLPYVEWETGSVFEPEQRLAVPAGTYLNPIAQLPSAAIERLFIFDATSPEQVAFAKDLMRQNIPLLNFMVSAGDLGPISEEMRRPVYHLTEQMLDKFQITAVPTLLGFGRGQHLGHLATTQFALPMAQNDIHLAWFGLPYDGYDPFSIQEPEVTAEEARRVRAAFTKAADTVRQSQSPLPGTGLTPVPR